MERARKHTHPNTPARNDGLEAKPKSKRIQQKKTASIVGPKVKRVPKHTYPRRQPGMAGLPETQS